MANTKAVQCANHQVTSNRILHNDIWSKKARSRMNTARERSITVINSTMSSEAALALQQLEIDGDEKTTSTKGNTDTEKSMKRTKSLPEHLYLQKSSKEPGKHKSDSDAEESTNDSHSQIRMSHVFEKQEHQKLEGDITDPQTWKDEGKKTKFVLGGGNKMENAMEIVEIVNADDPKPDLSSAAEDEEQAIAELARINSINKCNVWFEAHETLLENPACDSSLDTIS